MGGAQGVIASVIWECRNPPINGEPLVQWTERDKCVDSFKTVIIVKLLDDCCLLCQSRGEDYRADCGVDVKQLFFSYDTKSSTYTFVNRAGVTIGNAMKTLNIQF